MTSATTDSPIVYHLQQRKSRPHLTRSPATWQAFAGAMLHEHDERDDKDGLGFVLADFSTPYRLAENVTSYSAVLLDMDTGMGPGGRPETPPSVAYAFEQLQTSGLAGLIYTTHNHEAPASVNDGKPAGPRYRVIIPLAAPIAPSELKRVTMAAARRLRLDGPGLDPKSWVIGQFFYHPSCRPGAPRFAASSEGLPLDPAEADQPEPAPEPATAPEPAAVIRSPRPLSGGSLYDDTKGRARGQWRGILSSLGVTVPAGPRTPAACPGCGGKDRFRFDDLEGHGTFLCSQGGGGTLAGDGFDLVQHARHVDATEALRLVRDALGLERRVPRQAAQAPAPLHTPAQVDHETGEITEARQELAPANDNKPAWPRPLDVFAEFPAPSIEARMLPDAIAAHAFECGELVGVGPGMIAIPALVACAAALHDDVKIQPKRHETGWTESARLWCVVVGPPSVKKSASIGRAVRRLRRMDADMARENAKKIADHVEQMEAYKEAKKAAKKTGEAVPCPEAPAKERVVIEDITIESMVDVLKDNSRGVLCVQDELSGWFGSMDAYTGGKTGGKDRAAWLQAYNGGFRQVDRVTRGSVLIQNFSCSIIGGIQPDAIRRIAKDMTDDGLMQRFMVVIGRNAREFDRVENSTISRAFGELIDHLYCIVPGNTPVRLSEEAHQVRERLCGYASELSEYPALPGGLRSHLGKWSGLFARLLLVFHAIECADESIHPSHRQVSKQCAERVELLMRRFLMPHALAYYTDVLGANSDLEHARWVAGYILSRGLTTITNRDLMQAYKQWRGMDDWRRTRVMQVLEDMSWLHPISEEERKTRRSPTAWAVNPEVHDQFALRAEEEAERRARVRAEVQAMQSQR